jgi:hypothetical protein
MTPKKSSKKRPSAQMTPPVQEIHTRYPIKKYIFTAAQCSYYESTEKVKTGEKDENGRDKIDEQIVLQPWLGEGSAQLHDNFYDGLKRLARERGAELQILPMAGKCQREDVLHESVRDLPEVVDNWADNYRKLNDNVTRSDIRVPPQNFDPASGKASLPNRYQASLVYPHSKQRLAPVGTFQTWTRFLATTGCVTTPNYNWRNDKGNQAARDHVIGALFVEVLSPTQYNMRFLTATPNGQFVDLGEKFDGDSQPKRVGVEALIPGDIHLGAHDRKLLDATYGQIDYFKPKRLVLHDFFNGHSICHHELKDWMERARQFGENQLQLSLEEELQRGYMEIHRLANAVGKKAVVYLPHSNHDDFLKKYIEEDYWKRDPWNISIVGKIISTLPGKDDYLKNAYGIFGKLPENVEFLRLRDKRQVLGNNLSIHGHIGRNGSRGGGAKSKEAHFGKGIYGHTHAPEIYGDVHVVGTLAPDQAYMEGSSSSAMAANSVLYENGKKQMILMPNGRWR